jgi:hypothetical protein
MQNIFLLDGRETRKESWEVAQPQYRLYLGKIACGGRGSLARELNPTSMHRVRVDIGG